MREEAEITEGRREERIRQRILTGTKRYLDRLAELSERRLAGGTLYRARFITDRRYELSGGSLNPMAS
jgi:hypothetical protein